MIASGGHAGLAGRPAIVDRVGYSRYCPTDLASALTTREPDGAAAGSTCVAQHDRCHADLEGAVDRCDAVDVSWRADPTRRRFRRQRGLPQRDLAVP
jgi:hypothetical protein